MTLLKKTEQFVIKTLKKAKNENDIWHHKRTVYWIKKLKPDADEALLVAGMAHDIDRAFYGDWKAGSSDPKKLKKHGRLSALETEKFLLKHGAKKDFIKKVKHLIIFHEVGGDEEQNILCEADCLAYFEDKALRKAKKAKQEGKEKEIEKKLKYVFSRIHSQKAKKIAQQWYKKALHELKN